tara:strand:+ start:898 stop:1176 length:279 start_codon:yes stop_codon:yes gene_type:complete
MAKVTQMTGRTGKPVANQFIIMDGGDLYFQSYNTVIVRCTVEGDKRVTYLDRDRWDYSVTTSKYRNQFLNCDTAEVKRRIKSGTYRLADLNN